MSHSNESGWDHLTEHGSTGCVVVIAIFLAIYMPWIIGLYALGFMVWGGLKYAEHRQNQDKRNRET